MGFSSTSNINKRDAGSSTFRNLQIFRNSGWRYSNLIFWENWHIRLELIDWKIQYSNSIVFLLLLLFLPPLFCSCSFSSLFPLSAQCTPTLTEYYYIFYICSSTIWIFSFYYLDWYITIEIPTFQKLIHTASQPTISHIHSWNTTRLLLMLAMQTPMYSALVWVIWIA